MKKSISKWMMVVHLTMGFCLLLSIVLSESKWLERTEESIIKHFEHVINKKEDIAKDIIKELLKLAKASEPIEAIDNLITQKNALLKKNKTDVFVYDNQNLVFWSGNLPSVPFYDSVLAYAENGSRAIRMGDGWYLKTQGMEGSIGVTTYSLINTLYNYENQYLTNSFHEAYNVPEHYEISKNETEGMPIKNKGGDILFNLKLTGKKPYSQHSNAALFLFMVGVIWASVVLWKSERFLIGKYRNSLLFLPPLLIILLRWLMITYKIPESLYSIEEFKPGLYASGSFFPSFGDMILNVLAILWSVLFLGNKLKLNNLENNTKLHFQIPVLIGVFLAAHFSLVFFENLIIHSTISYDFSNIFQLNIDSLLGILSAATVFISFSIGVYYVSIFFTKLNKRSYFIFGIILLLLYISAYLTGKNILLAMAFSVVLLVGSLLIRKRDISPLSFYPSLILIVLFSVISGSLLNQLNVEKEQALRKALAINLALEHDPVAEYIFTRTERNIQDDNELKELLRKEFPNEEDIYNRLVTKYFAGYWNNYDIQLTLCNEGDSLWVLPDNVQKDCYSFFESIIYAGVPSLSCDLYLLNKGMGVTSYIAEIQIVDSANIYRPETRFYIEFNSKFVHKGLGYPELLIDKNIRKNIDLAIYSYAIYQNGFLLNQFGRFLYPLTSEYTSTGQYEYMFFESEDHSHLIYALANNTHYVISKKTGGFLGTVTPYSYMMLIYGIFIFCISLISYIRYRKTKIQTGIKSRIQWTVVSVVFASLLLIGSVSIYYTVKLFDMRNREVLKEKVHSIQMELIHSVGSEHIVSSDRTDYIAGLLLKLSNSFFTDINIYDLQGRLIAGSREAIFNEGLTGRLMHPDAYQKLSIGGSSLHVQKEYIGKLGYLSAYSPFFNSNNEIIAYINLPYFSKEHELRKELSIFLVAIVNIYVLLFAASILIAIVLSSYITKPLSLIRDKMAKVKLGAKNESISWKGKDEIGNLIEEYNRMVEEITESAEKLARSERESAWKEMARQVAHEIKNPLTPMKLNVQYLEKAWKEKAPDWDERLRRFKEMMIGQIDTLANIADAFSNFSNLPQSKQEEVCINKLLEASAYLFRDTGNVDVVYEKTDDNEHFIIADNAQLQQVLNNLLKNAVQSIPSSRQGIVTIKLFADDHKYRIIINDNGIGIPDSIRSKIFQPYFTSKSKGTGLGLAMVKSIIESMNGSISFETSPDAGSTFEIVLPIGN